jgi:hypothetical protein
LHTKAGLPKAELYSIQSALNLTGLRHPLTLVQIFMLIPLIPRNLLIIFISLFVLACKAKQKPLDDKNIVFHGAPQNNGIGSLSLALYKDGRYQIINSGGIGAYNYSGNFKVSGDTIILENLDKESSLASNRLLIYRYDEQDSSFWLWKHSKSIGVWEWRDFKEQDSMKEKGNVFQLDKDNKPTKDKPYFRITIDSLKNFR